MPVPASAAAVIAAACATTSGKPSQSGWSIGEETREILWLRRVDAPSGFGQCELPFGFLMPSQTFEQVADSCREIRRRRFAGQIFKQAVNARATSPSAASVFAYPITAKG